MNFVFGDYALAPAARALTRRGKSVSVEPKVFDLLTYLIEHRERVVSADELLDALWSGVSVTPAALSRTVQKARHAVGDDGEHQVVLRTEHGHGFRFVADVSVIDAPATALRTPAGFQIRWVVAAGVAAVLLVAVIAWLLIRPVAEPAPTRSIAVLPLVDPSGDPEYFADGMTETLTTNLAKISALKVIARTSVDRLDPNLSVREIGSELGVATVLEGGVQRAGDRVRVNVQLIDCETEAHLWAETYDREMSVANFFAIQSEIATTVADALRATLSPEEEGRLATVPTENVAAYEAYLLGRQRFARGTIAALVEAADYFQQAIELDPGLALAFVGLADSYVEQVYLGTLTREEGLARAQAAAEKALALDDRSGEAYNSLAGIKDSRQDFEGAEAMYRRALELNPNYATAYYWYGFLLRVSLGRFEEALALHRKAAELDPLSAPIIEAVGESLESLGRFDEALARYQRALEVDPGYAGTYAAIGMHYARSGQLDEAVIWLAKSISLDPASPLEFAWLGGSFLDLGDFDRAESWIERSLELGPESFWPNFTMHALHLYRGDEAAALDYARRASSFNLLFVPGVRRDHELRAGRYAEARALYEESHPELLNEGDPTVDGSNWKAAIGLALVLSKTGEQEHADLLLDRSLGHIQTLPRLGTYGYGIADVQIYALRGDKQKSLSALRQAIDEGWRNGWRYRLKHDLTLESLHDEPEYQAMVAEIEADMAAQLARVREMERNGELAAILRDKTNLH